MHDPCSESRMSLSEIEALALKAARGAGLSWGMAEEAGYATRWLAEQGIDGPALLLTRLDQLSTVTGAAAPPQINGRRWSPTGPAALCPLVTGVALNDFAMLPEGPVQGSVRVGPVATPALLLPFVAMIAARSDAGFRVVWDGCVAIVSKAGLCRISASAAMMADATEVVRISPCPPPASRLRSLASFATTAAALRALDIYASRTYVPASEHSRRGAGAADIDQS